MTPAEQPPTVQSKPSRTVAAVATAVTLLAVLGGVLLYQRSENRALDEQLRRAEDRLEQHGAIKLTDAGLLHVRWLPTRQKQEEVACRVHVPAQKAYRLMLHAGPIPPDGSLPEEGAGFQVPVVLPAHDVDRELTAFGGLQFNRKQETWEIFCRIIDATGIEYPLNGVTLFIPPAYQQYFYIERALRTFESQVDRAKTCVFDDAESYLLLAAARAYEPPLDTEGNVDYGEMSPLEWIQSQKDNPATGFMFWIEKASGEASDQP